MFQELIKVNLIDNSIYLTQLSINFVYDVPPEKIIGLLLDGHVDAVDLVPRISPENRLVLRFQF